MKRAFLVVGPESSGLRLVTRILISMGCWGDGQMEQRLDKGLPEHGGDIVWIRSFPHFGRESGKRHWPNLIELNYKLICAGYWIRGIVVARDMKVTALSQVRAGHVLSYAEGLENIREAQRRIFSQIATCQMLYVSLTYEQLVKRPGWVVEFLSEQFLLDQPEQIEEVFDGNDKY